MGIFDNIKRRRILEGRTPDQLAEAAHEAALKARFLPKSGSPEDMISKIVAKTRDKK